MRPDHVILLVITLAVMVVAVVTNIRAFLVGDRNMGGKYIAIAVMCFLMGVLYLLDLVDYSDTRTVSFWLRILFATQIVLVAIYPAIVEPRMFKKMQLTALHSMLRNMEKCDNGHSESTTETDETTTEEANAVTVPHSEERT